MFRDARKYLEYCRKTVEKGPKRSTSENTTFQVCVNTSICSAKQVEQQTTTQTTANMITLLCSSRVSKVSTCKQVTLSPCAQCTGLGSEPGMFCSETLCRSLLVSITWKCRASAYFALSQNIGCRGWLPGGGPHVRVPIKQVHTDG